MVALTLLWSLLHDVYSAYFFHYFSKYILHFIKFSISKSILDGYLSHPFLDVLRCLICIFLTPTAVQTRMTSVQRSVLFIRIIFFIFWGFGIVYSGIVKVAFSNVITSIYIRILLHNVVNSRINFDSKLWWFFCLIRLILISLARWRVRDRLRFKIIVL